MTINIDELSCVVAKLCSEVDTLVVIRDRAEQRRSYQQWYSQAQLLVTAHLPSMAEGFRGLYYSPKDSNSEADAWLYFGIRSYLRTVPGYDHEKMFRDRFLADIEQQRGILSAIPATLKIRTLEIAAIVTADLVSGELNEARLLLEHGFERAAGAVAGVALEAHLKLLHEQSNMTFQDNDTIVPLATGLRQNNVITLGDEKKCIAMADTRNKCDHKHKEEPTTDEVSELIDDVDRFVKRVQVM